MIGLDTNVIARVVLADDAVQTKQALALLESCQSKGEVVAISLSVILELEWVQRSETEQTSCDHLDATPARNSFSAN